MEFVCLAAGTGTRMGRLGVYLQKCMYPVGLRPFLELSMAEAAVAGAERVHLVVGHLQEQVRAYFGARFGGLEINYVEQPRPLGTGHALGLVAPHLDPESGPVLVWQADVFAPHELFAALLHHRAPNALTLVEEEDSGPDVKVSAEGTLVTRVWQGAGPFSDGGVWKFERRLLTELAGRAEDSGEYRCLPNLQLLIEAGEAEVGFVCLGRRLHIGGTFPSAEANVADVVTQLLALKRQG